MTAKQLKGRFIRKVMMHMLFQIGGAVVLIGALFKILHLEIGPLTGGVVLGLGLGTEAIIFLIGGLMLDDVREEQAEYEAYLTKGGATAGGEAGEARAGSGLRLLPERQQLRACPDHRASRESRAGSRPRGLRGEGQRSARLGPGSPLVRHETVVHRDDAVG